MDDKTEMHLNAMSTTSFMPDSNSDKTEIRLNAMINALAKTDQLFDMFEDVLKDTDVQTHTEKDFSKDFSAAASKILGLSESGESPIFVAQKSGTNTHQPIEKNRFSNGDKNFVSAAQNSDLSFQNVTHSNDERFSMSFDKLRECAMQCQKCKLCKTRTHVVFGEGCAEHPDIMIIGEGPGETEDLTGRPFVGKSGQYLDTWLKPISSSRDKNVYIANIVKCRPPMNRDPETDEKTACKPFIEQQINLVNPRAILCLGLPSSREFTEKIDAPMGAIRGKFFLYKSEYPLICTYHPSAVLRNPSLRRPVWEDLQKLARFLNLEIVK